MRILHLSDSHLRYNLPGRSSIPARDSRGVLGRLEYVLSQVSELAVDIVIHTGDVIDYPLDLLDDPAARQTGRADLQLVRSLMDQLPVPYVVIPGNHDHPMLFEQVLGDQSFDLTVEGYRFISFWDQEDSLHWPTRSAADWQRFHAVLTDGDPTPQVHIQHFVVYPELNDDYPHTYDEGAEMAKAMAQSGRVILSLSGHYHPGTEPILRDGVCCSTVPAICEAPFAYRLYDLTGEQATVATHFAADADGGKG